VDALVMEDTPVEYLLKRFPTLGMRMEDMRAILGRFGLSGHHHLQPICKLSGARWLRTDRRWLRSDRRAGCIRSCCSQRDTAPSCCSL
jgi:hypothetical protein